MLYYPGVIGDKGAVTGPGFTSNLPVSSASSLQSAIEPEGASGPAMSDSRYEAISSSSFLEPQFPHLEAEDSNTHPGEWHEG